MDSSIQHLVKMTNQIATFFASQSVRDPEAAAHSVASHLRLFWAPSMRHDLIAAFDAGHAEGLEPIAAAALRSHRAELLVATKRVAMPDDETFPEGGGDAG